MRENAVGHVREFISNKGNNSWNLKNGNRENALKNSKSKTKEKLEIKI